MTSTPARQASVADVDLAAGDHARTVEIVARTDPRTVVPIHPDHWLARIDRPAASELVEAFFRAIDVGCFGSAGPVTVLSSATRDDGGIRVDTWTAALPPLAPGAFDALCRMADTMAERNTGLRAVSIHETTTAGSRVGRDTLGGLLTGPWPFSVDDRNGGRESKELGVLVTFEQDLAKSDSEAAIHAIASWGRVLAWGGFPSGSTFPSAGFISDLSEHLDNEIAATITFFTATNVAWDALLRGLAVVHGRAAIERVEIG